MRKNADLLFSARGYVIDAWPASHASLSEANLIEANLDTRWCL